MTESLQCQYISIHDVNVVAVVVICYIVTVLLSVSCCGQVVRFIQWSTQYQRRQLMACAEACPQQLQVF